MKCGCGFHIEGQVEICPRCGVVLKVLKESSQGPVASSQGNGGPPADQETRLLRRLEQVERSILTAQENRRAEVAAYRDLLKDLADKKARVMKRLERLAAGEQELPLEEEEGEG